MIIIHPLRIAFQDVPKVGSTSLLRWLYELIIGKPYEAYIDGDGNKIWVHDWFAKQVTDKVTNVAVNRFIKPNDYFVFCITREPIERFLSAYKNRVIHFRELAEDHPCGIASIEAGLLANPELDYFVEHLNQYQNVSTNIFHHTRPMVDFIGQDPGAFDKIFDLGEMHLLRQELIKHWQSAHIYGLDREFPPISREQADGPSLGIDALSPKSFDALLGYYAKDYALLPKCHLVQIRKEKNETIGKYDQFNHDSVLIVTYGRTGSTLLQGLLNSTRGVLIRGENYNFCVGLFESYKLLLKIQQNNEGMVSVPDTNPFYGMDNFCESNYFDDARRLVKNQFLPHRDESIRCWGFKEIRYKPEDLTFDGRYCLESYLDFLSKLFPRPLFVFLSRNHEDVLKSGFWTQKDSQYAKSQIERFEIAARKWSTGRVDCFWITYEEIIANTLKLKELYARLGARYNPLTIQRILGIEHSYGNKQETLDRPKSWSSDVLNLPSVLDCSLEPSLPPLIKQGETFSLGGVVVLQPTLPMGMRLIAVDSEGDHEVQWGIPSPKYSTIYAGNRHALNGRFKVEGLRLGTVPVEIMLIDPQGHREVLARIAYKFDK